MLQSTYWCGKFNTFHDAWTKPNYSQIIFQRVTYCLLQISLFLVGVIQVGKIPPDESVLSGASWVVERPRSVLRGRHSALGEHFFFEFLPVGFSLLKNHQTKSSQLTFFLTRVVPLSAKFQTDFSWALLWYAGRNLGLLEFIWRRLGCSEECSRSNVGFAWCSGASSATTETREDIWWGSYSSYHSTAKFWIYRREVSGGNGSPWFYWNHHHV